MTLLTPVKRASRLIQPLIQPLAQVAGLSGVHCTAHFGVVLCDLTLLTLGDHLRGQRFDPGFSFSLIQTMQFGWFGHDVEKTEFGGDHLTAATLPTAATATATTTTPTATFHSFGPGDFAHSNRVFDAEEVFVAVGEFASRSGENPAAVGQTPDGGAHVAQARVQLHSGGNTQVRGPPLTTGCFGEK